MDAYFPGMQKAIFLASGEIENILRKHQESYRLT
jgi:hypothetical protein